MLYGQEKAVCDALRNWEELEWVKYLRAHGAMEDKTVLTDGTGTIRHCVTTWNLPAEYETYFRLRFGDMCNVEDVE